MDEVWKDIEGYEGLYQVSNLGRIKSLPRYSPGPYTRTGVIKKQAHDNYGYPIISLCKNGRPKTFTIHRLVAKAFVPNPFGYKEVNHIDENKDNNCFDNLEWCTTRYNLTYGHRLDCARGENNNKHKLTEKDVKEIRKVYVKNDLHFGQNALARKYDVSRPTIAAIVEGKSWKHIKEDDK